MACEQPEKTRTGKTCVPSDGNITVVSCYIPQIQLMMSFDFDG
jgi:hypothetical protein